MTINDVMKDLSPKLDSSNYPTNHPLYSTVNKARLGCFKDETGGKILKEFILLRPKMYSMCYEDEDTVGIRRAKGIQTHVVRNLSHQDYLNVYNSTGETAHDMNTIESKAHIIRTKSFRKRSLSIWEDKRFWVDKNFSVPYGFMKEVPGPNPKHHRTLPPSGDIVFT